MVTEPHEHGFIPGIFNYCDRWCERCAFSSRCRVYAMEMAIAIDGFEGELAARAADLPPDSSEEGSGVDFLADGEEDLAADSEVEQELLRRDAAHLMAEAHPLSESAKALADLAGPLIQAAAAQVEAGGAEGEALRDPLDVLCHYRWFILAKVRRALMGREESSPYDDEGQPLASDADGSAKIAHITCAAALQAACHLGALDAALAPLATAYAQTADRILHLIDQAFPHHRAFRRPGFDDDPEQR